MKTIFFVLTSLILITTSCKKDSNLIPDSFRPKFTLEAGWDNPYQIQNNDTLHYFAINVGYDKSADEVGVDCDHPLYLSASNNGTYIFMAREDVTTVYTSYTVKPWIKRNGNKYFGKEETFTK